MVDFDPKMCEAEEWTVVDGPVMHWASHIDVMLKDYSNRSQWMTAFFWDKGLLGWTETILSSTKTLEHYLQTRALYVPELDKRYSL